jgi:hypothetical protein
MISAAGLLPYAIIGFIINFIILRANWKTNLLILTWMLGILRSAVCIYPNLRGKSLIISSHWRYFSRLTGGLPTR